jgi:hypothetical protein
MNNIHLISFGCDKYKNSIKRLYIEANDSKWFNSITIYTPKDIDFQFKNKHKEIFNYERGYGYWIWKNYFIRKRLNEIRDNDILLYLDCGCTINKYAKNRFFEYIELINNSNKDVLSFELNLIENNWTIDQIFKIFDISDSNKIYNSKQLIGTIRFFKKTDNSLNLINELYNIIDNNNLLITDKYNKIQKNKNFKDNRHDQSISSVFYKYNNATIILKDETYPYNKDYPFYAARLK